jgi:enoyl-CoA hydratase
MLLKKPVIAAISGYAVAGGMELACWCDLRVVDQSAILGIYCRMRGRPFLVVCSNLGVPLIDGGTIRLPRMIGLSRAMDIILTGYALGKSPV